MIGVISSSWPIGLSSRMRRHVRASTGTPRLRAMIFTSMLLPSMIAAGMPSSSSIAWVRPSGSIGGRTTYSVYGRIAGRVSEIDGFNPAGDAPEHAVDADQAGERAEQGRREHARVAGHVDGRLHLLGPGPGDVVGVLLHALDDQPRQPAGLH